MPSTSADVPNQYRAFGIFALVSISASLKVVGAVTVLPLVGLLLLPCSFRILTKRPFQPWSILLVAWLIAQLFSDVVNGGGVRFSAAASAPAVVLFIFGTLTWLIVSRAASARTIALAVCIGLSVYSIRYAPESFSRNIWKYQLAEPATLAILALLDTSRFRTSTLRLSVGMCALAAMSFVADYRSLCGVVVVAMGIFFLRTRSASSSVTSPRFVAAAALSAVLLLTIALPAAASAGLLGERSNRQYFAGNASDASFLVDARPEIVQSAYLFAQHPILGWGSDPDVTAQDFLAGVQLLTDIGFTATKNSITYLAGNQRDGLANHSMSMDSALRAGIFALPFWVGVLYLCIRTAIAGPPRPVLIVWAGIVGWGLLFSGTSYPQLILLAGFLAMAKTSEFGRDPAESIVGHLSDASRVERSSEVVA